MSDRPQTPEGGETLEPCPFCGEEPFYKSGGGKYPHWIMCGSSICPAEPCVNERTRDAATEAWNRRGAPPPALKDLSLRSPAPEAVEAVREALELAIREGWRCGRDSVLHSIAARDGVTPETEDDAVAYIMTADPIRAALSAPRVEAEPDGMALIRRERERQVSEEGWTPEHDEEHVFGELSGAGASYAEAASRQIAAWPRRHPVDRPNQMWRFEGEWWKPSPDPIRNLVKAGALIAAEIDRLIRDPLPAPPETKDDE